MKRWLSIGWVLCAVLTAHAEEEGGFALEPEVQERLGLETSPAQAMSYAAEAEGSGSTMDLVPLLTLEADLVAAEAALTASSANYTRTASLHADRDNASTAALETARAQQAADRARRDALQRQLRLGAGDALAALEPAQREALFDRLSSGEAVLLRADFAPGTVLPALESVRIVAVEGGESVLEARVLGRTTSANPQRPGPGLLVLADPPGWLQPGRAVRVLAVTGATARSGVLVPQSAVLHREGALWVYVLQGEDRFERRRLSDVVALPEGLFDADDVHVGEPIVVRGAASLLAAEVAASNAGGEEEED